MIKIKDTEQVRSNYIIINIEVRAIQFKVKRFNKKYNTSMGIINGSMPMLWTISSRITIKNDLIISSTLIF